MKFGECPFKKKRDRLISTLTFAEFKNIYSEYKNKKPKPKQRRLPILQTVKKKRPRIPYVRKKDEGKLYDRFEYGLSDW